MFILAVMMESPPRPSSLFPIICHHIPPAARPDTMHSVLLPKPLWTLLIMTLFSATLFTFLTQPPLVSWRSGDVSCEGGASRARSILSLSAVISANELMTAQYSHYTPCKGGTLCNVLPCTPPSKARIPFSLILFNYEHIFCPNVQQ